MSTANINVESAGHLSARAGVPLGRVLRAVEALGISPALIVDDVLHFAENDAQRIVEHIVGQQQGKVGPGR
jgi:hypothetical protein